MPQPAGPQAQPRPTLTSHSLQSPLHRAQPCPTHQFSVPQTFLGLSPPYHIGLQCPSPAAAWRHPSFPITVSYFAHFVTNLYI